MYIISCGYVILGAHVPRKQIFLLFYILFSICWLIGALEKSQVSTNQIINQFFVILTYCKSGYLHVGGNLH